MRGFKAKFIAHRLEIVEDATAEKFKIVCFKGFYNDIGGTVRTFRFVDFRIHYGG